MVDGHLYNFSNLVPELKLILVNPKETFYFFFYFVFVNLICIYYITFINYIFHFYLDFFIYL